MLTCSGQPTTTFCATRHAGTWAMWHERLKFLKQARCDTPCAAALDRVHRHPALVAELSKVLFRLRDRRCSRRIRQRFRSIEGMHKFMRLAGVVKEYVASWDCRSRTNAM
ncbi:hypothetical protein MRX96_019202 [Rhipicephalus microplus]